MKDILNKLEVQLMIKMKKFKVSVSVIGYTLSLCFIAYPAQAQQILWFGTVKVDDKFRQGRFEIDSLQKTIIYAPYGITPVAFKDVKREDKQLTFLWQFNHLIYNCTLLKQEKGVVYKGNCTSQNAKPIELVMREFTEDDGRLQGNALQASSTDIQILDRALALMNNGNNWNRSDDRICDNSPYPYKWSLFCALHQASIDVDSEYRHLRPAIQAARQAIEEATAGKKFAHVLRDFNNEAQSFDSIARVLNKAKEIVTEKMKNVK